MTGAGAAVEVRAQYQAPSVQELGTVAEVTLMPIKVIGYADGFTLNDNVTPLCQPGLNCS